MKQKEYKPKVGLSRLMELAGRRKSQLTRACVFSVLSAAARMIPFFTIYGLLKQIVLHYHNLTDISVSTMLLLVGATAASAVAYGVLGYTSSSLSHRAAFNILYELRLQLMKKLSRLPAGYFTGTTKGGLKKVIQDDVEKIEEFIAHNITDTVAAIALPIFTIVYLFFMDWRLALCIVVLLVICIFVLAASMKNPEGVKTQMAMHETRKAMNSSIVEYVHGMPVIKVFNRKQLASARLEKSIDESAYATKDAAHFFRSYMGMYFTAMGAQLLLILPVGLVIGLYAKSYTDFLPLLLLFFLVGTGLKEPLENMMSLALSTNNISIGVARIDSILAEKELTVPKNTVEPLSYDIKFEHVQFSYNQGGSKAVDDLSFALKQNTITGLVGPSGGGKSTTAQLLLRFYEPQSGRITIGGVDIGDIAPGKLMEHIGYVFQESVMFADTVEQNIRMGNTHATRKEVEQAAKSAAIHDVIMALPRGYATVLGEDNTYLSGGEKQRISIARVFLKNPDIIILDEATAYADAENENLIQESFAKLAEGKTVLIIAHRLKTIEKADQILVMENGRLEALGTHHKLLESSPTYRRMVDANERREIWSMQKTTEEEGKHNA